MKGITRISIAVVESHTSSMFTIMNLPTGELKCSGFIRQDPRHVPGFVALVAIYEGMCLPKIVSGSISS
jgi:hypothetical protein